MIDLIQRRREMMGASVPPRQYVYIYKNMYPSNGYIDGRNSFFLYLTEYVDVGTDIHLSLTFTSMDSTISLLSVKESSASVPSITIPMPQNSIDVEFKVSKQRTNTLWCLFDKSVSGVQIDTSITKVEKII